MGIRWHPEILSPDGPVCGNIGWYQSILRVDLASFFAQLLFGAMEELFRDRRGDSIAHAKLGAKRPVRES